MVMSPMSGVGAPLRTRSTTRQAYACATTRSPSTTNSAGIRARHESSEEGGASSSLSLSKWLRSAAVPGP
jgi:hypothetical protein